MMDIEKETSIFEGKYQAIHEEIAKMIVGHAEVVEQVLICLFAGGHTLLEGVPGLGKTLLVRTLSQVLDVEFSRIQFTPDLMPADIVGTNIVVDAEGGGKQFEFQRGPIFGNIILADEVNRATPKTQSALLEAMEEKRVTVARITHQLPMPFFVLATQNPIEMEGTYPLPEAQLDRFMLKLNVEPSNLDELGEIIDRTTGKQLPQIEKVVSGEEVMQMRAIVREVPIAAQVKEYVGKIVLATHPQAEFAADITKRYVRYGASPRGAQAIVLASKVTALMSGRFNVSFDDVEKTAKPALRHRIIRSFEGEAEGVEQDRIVDEILESVSA